MALPTIKTLADCSDFSKTVVPFLPQLRSLPFQIYNNIGDTAALKQVYLDTNPLITALAFALFLAPIFLVASEINKNYSQVDRFWSILPTVNNAHFVTYAHLKGIETQKLDTLLAASVLWSMRLTFNYWRRGGYNIGSEDYRWPIIKDYVPSWAFFLFNVFFIATAQPILLLLITTPTYLLLLISSPGSTSQAWSLGDLIFSRIMVGCIILSAFADQQQWTYQEAKYEYRRTAKIPQGCKYDQDDLDRGFNVSGLWAWSRHPNFLGEQAFWVTLYQWGCWEADALVNWTGVGALAYLLLFQASTWLTELISASKYPEYKAYQKMVGKFIPVRLGSAEEVQAKVDKEEQEQKSRGKGESKKEK
ncbi:MAG: hypothetical protein Q9227_001753 [Pyrenula ochraceoflavens]